MSELATEHGALWVRGFGDPPAPVVALHGFTLHGGMFKTLADELGVSIQAPDLPGHGRTTVDPVTVDSAVEALAHLLRQNSKPPLLLGYSQGGRIAIQVALAHPNLVGSLVLVSASPGLDEKAHRLRAVADDALATRIEEIGIDRFIEEWLANPTTATDRVATATRDADRKIRLENSAAGLAAALRGLGQAAVPEARDRLATLPMPIAFVAGRWDSKYSALAVEMAHSRSERPVLVGGAGHNVILEAPEIVAATVRDLLGRQTG